MLQRWSLLLTSALTLGLAACGKPGGSPPAPANAALVVPTAAGVEAEEAEAGAISLTAVPSPPETLEAAAAAPSVTPPPREDAEAAAVAPLVLATVTVGSGDTLLGLAFDYGVPMAAIQLQNDLGSSQTIQLGQQLTLPPASAWEGASPFWIVHVVSDGETLSEIAKAYGLTVTDLQGANGLADVDLLGVGQALVLPLTGFVEAQDVAQSPSAAPSVADAPPTPTAATAAAGVSESETPASAAETGDFVTPAPAPPAVAGPPAVADFPYETVRIMNEVRAQHGLPPLIYNETLAQAAQIQADDCAARGSCSHTGSDGSTIKERILRVGYAPRSWAECWAIRPTPQEAIDIWMDEIPPNDPHRRTLLTTWLTEIGIGVAKTTWGYYFIADFGIPLQ